MSSLTRLVILLGLLVIPLCFIIIGWKNAQKKKRQQHKIDALLNSATRMPEQKKLLEPRLNFNSLLAIAIIAISLILFLKKVPIYVLLLVNSFVLLLVKNIYQFIRNSHLTKLTEDLPSTIDFLARAIKSGDSFLVAIEHVAQANFPASPRFKSIHEALSRGKPFAETLNKAATKLNHPDFTLCMAILIIQQETGKHDTSHLNHLSTLLRKKIALRKKIKSNSAEAIFGGYLLVCIPLTCFIILGLMDKTYFDPLFNTKLGQNLLIYGICSNIIGLVVIKKMTQIKI